ncbi:MAG TPA: phosphotransferase family protein [Acidimicrobiales bacterium]|nr:phosphotransferase family protein [Acidimicrobiales bacterium]
MVEAAGPESVAGAPAAPPDGPDASTVTQARRDPDRLAAGLRRWLVGQLGEQAAPEVVDIDRSSANGMSSETVLFDATWRGEDGPVAERLVARLEPDLDDVPVFPSYELGHQAALLRAVAELTSVPVPTVRWWEPDRSWVGAPFFVMDRVDGDVPPDVLPYTFGDNWLFAAPPEDRRALQDATVAVLAELHGIEDAAARFAFLDPSGPSAGGGTALRRHVARTRAWYEWSVRASGMRSALVEQGFARLDETWPDEGGEAVLSWGDARIGNVIYRASRPVAVLDWEMAGVGPRELDVAWLLMAHRVFQDLAAQWDLPGLPSFLRVDDVAGQYERLTGHSPRALDWYGTYAALQWGIVFLRTGHRQVAHGQVAAPDAGDDLLHHRDTLARAVDGRPWG